MGGLHLLLRTDHKEPPHTRNLHLVPKIGYVIIPSNCARSQPVNFPQATTPAHSASVCFCFTSDGEVPYNYLGRSSSGSISLRGTCTQDLIQSSVFIRTSSFFFHLHWCRSSDVLQGQSFKRTSLGGEKVMDASCKNLFQSIISNTMKNLKWRPPLVFQHISFRQL